jgi:hypothetical protein
LELLIRKWYSSSTRGSFPIFCDLSGEKLLDGDRTPQTVKLIDFPIDKLLIMTHDS